MNVHKMAFEDLSASSLVLPFVFVFFFMSVGDFNFPFGKLCSCVVQVVEGVGTEPVARGGATLPAAAAVVNGLPAAFPPAVVRSAVRNEAALGA